MFTMHWLYSVLLLSIVGLFPSIKSNNNDCNEFICGSVVSKCLLTQSCQCKLTDCFCCKDCFNCLGGLFTECCSCLELCPKRNDTLSALTPTSQIGDFEGVPELFDILTAEDDDDKWIRVSFPMQSSLQHHYNMATGTFGFGSSDDALNKQSSVNCTVIYLNICTTNQKCSENCENMGSKSYRWFHDGCCECVGANCINYGINESRCTACSDDNEYVDEDEDDPIFEENESEL